MENLTPLLEKLAEKLGTTTEYLWSVLIHQAPISALTDLLYFVLVIIGGIVIFIIHKRLMKKNKYGNNKYDDSDDGLIVLMVVVTLVWAIIFIVCFFNIGNIITGFFNPEYWALNKVLGLLK